MITQPSFYIPPDIEAGLLSGDLILFGGIVRNRLGQIVKHLSEISVSDNSKKALERAAVTLKSPIAITAVALVTATLATAAFFVVWQRKRGGKPAVPECVERYNASLGEYLDAVRAQRLDADIIDRLIFDFDAVRAYSDENGGITLDFKTKQGESLFKLVVDYTRQLAEANPMNSTQLQLAASVSDDDPAVNLRRHLEVQRDIFNAAA